MELKLLYILFSFCFAIKAQKNAFSFDYKYNDDNSIDITYVKNKPGCYHMRYEFSSTKNTSSSGFEGNICNNSGTLIHLNPINSNEQINFTPDVFYSLGILNPKIDKDFTYVLPFKKGKTIQLFESYNIQEKYFETKKSNWKAYSIQRDVADTVIAVRKGIVVKIIDTFNASKTTIGKHFTSKRNSITIEHNDGTFAFYSGFEKNSIQVHIGQQVYPYTPLGTLSFYDQKKYNLGFYLYYNTKEITRKSVHESFKGKESPYSYITPYFLTRDGLKKATNKSIYISEFNGGILKKEFTKRELRRLKKNPDLFYNY